MASTGETQTYTFDVDLALAAAQLAQLVEDLTGLDVSADEPPPPDASSGDSGAATAKPIRDKQELNLTPYLFPSAFSFVGFTVTSIMGQMLQAVLGFVAFSIQAAIVGIFAPFILMGSVLRMAFGQPPISVNLGLIGPTISIPSRPFL